MADRPNRRATDPSFEDADARYRRLIEQSGVGLFQTRTDGSIEWMNSAAAQLFGYESAEEFIASTDDIRDVYVDPTRRDDLLRALEKEGGVTGFEYEMRRRDGAHRWLSITARASRSENGSLEGFEGTFVDVTERRMLEAATRAMSSDLEPTEAVSRFAEVLRRTVPFRQLSLIQVRGDSYRRIVSIGDRDYRPLPLDQWLPIEGHPLEAVVRTQGPLVVQDTMAGEWPFDATLKDRGVGSYAIIPLPTDPDSLTTFNVGMSDPGAFNSEVMSLLSAHTAAVTNAVRNILLFENQRELVRQLEEVARLRNEFLASASHDLRNPVSVMCGVAEVLEARWDEIDEDRKVKMLGSLARSARIVQQLLQRDLDVALIETGELHYEIEPFDLDRLVRDVLDGFEQSGAGRGFAFRSDGGLPSALGDERRQTQILHNLVSNAVKFSPEGSTVTVEVEREGGELRVTVSDEGPGIAEADLALLFKRLSRLESSEPGTGLGLYMAKSMVEAQGGRIWAESTPGRGARFTYTVPIAA
ncbi:MAG TPA: PAS domain-containing sensor histidine kinase [Actinomycetota bacterium]|nr:PAS domain-containing sensor histidine kinase [Actinomycetota bacterium]